MAPSSREPPAGSAATLEGSTLDARYRITSTLGAGGMATVYLAQDDRLERSVVVKLPHAALAVQPDFVARFEREIKSLTRIEHPHVLKVLDTGSHAGLPYAVLQHLSGGSLRDKLDRAGGKLAPVEILPWLLQIAEALDHIHERGLIHRDVKPGNVLFDDTGNVVIADFGIAKSLASSDTGITATGMTPGSPGYMAPEVMKGGALGPMYDQFSLAVVVFEALAGRLPFSGTTPIEQIGALLNEPPADLASLAPEVSPLAADVVMRALSKDPSKRFASCTEFAKTFQAALGVPTVAVFPKKFASAMRKRRWLRVGAAAAALVAVGVTGVLIGRRGGTPTEEPETGKQPATPPSKPLEKGETPWTLLTPEAGPAWARVSQKQIDEAQRLGIRVAFENELGMRFVLIPAGKFTMGSPEGEAGRDADEPQREATVPAPFYLQTTEVTYAQFRRLRSGHVGRAWSGSRVDIDELPLTDVSLDDIETFTRWAGADGRRYRIPKDEEWELACRAGTATAAFWGDSMADAGHFANVTDRTAKARWSDWRIVETTDGSAAAAAPATYAPNPWGLFDMIGNAAEIVRGDGEQMIVRGGSWAADPSRCRSAARDIGRAAEVKHPLYGVRLVSEIHWTDRGDPPWPIVRPEGAPPDVRVSQLQIDEAKRLDVPVWFENSVGMRFVLIPAGKFVMGSPEDDPDRFTETDEPQHEAQVDRAFYIQVCEVTNAQLRTWNADHHVPPFEEAPLDRDDLAAAWQSPTSIEAFAKHLANADGRGYRLPSEVEWEYVARAGSTGSRYWTTGLLDVARFENITDRAAVRRWPRWGGVDVDDGFEAVAPVGSFLPNPWGIFDVLGNVAEWCRAGENAGGGVRFVARGGCWSGTARATRCTNRMPQPGDVGGVMFGFRLVCDLPPPPTIDIVEPADGAALDEGLVTVRGATNAKSPTVRVNGVTGDVKDGAFDVSITLPPGEQEIEVVAGKVSAIRKVRVTSVPRPEAGWPGVPAWAKVSKQQIDEAKRLGVDVAFENSLGMRFVLVPAGRFLMGAAPDEVGRASDDVQRWVTLQRPFHLSTTEVTNAQVRRHVPTFTSGDNDGLSLDGDDQPAGSMTIDDQVDLAKRVGAVDGRSYRLPSEAEWEYACRAGTGTRWYWGADPKAVAGHENVADAEAARKWPGFSTFPGVDDGFAVTSPVGRFAPNPWGLHDMLGNLLERCADFGGEPLTDAPVVDPTGPAAGTTRIIRGSSHKWNATQTRASWRAAAPPTAFNDIGFRLVADLPEKR